MQRHGEQRYGRDFVGYVEFAVCPSLVAEAGAGLLQEHGHPNPRATSARTPSTLEVLCTTGGVTPAVDKIAR